MAIKQLNPYLNFNGDAAQAIALYENVFGVKAHDVSTFASMPNTPPDHANRIIHARIPLAGSLLMISDTPPGAPPVAAGNISVALDFDDVAETSAKFSALAIGGTITMPLQQMFWGATFGMLVDAHGIAWMFNGPKAAQ